MLPDDLCVFCRILPILVNNHVPISLATNHLLRCVIIEI